MNKKLICALVASAILLVSVGVEMTRPAQAGVVLSVGARGQNVIRVQERLKQFGYLTGETDGIFGDETYRAVLWFQRRNGLIMDGRVGPATAEALGITLSADTSPIMSLTANQLLLAKVVYGEARGENYKGKVAVAAVVLNRVRSSSFPNTISGVVYQKNAFSCVANGSIDLTPDNDSIRAAKEALNGWDPTGGCLYFYNSRLTSDAFLASLTVKTVIGNHSFAV